MNRKYIKVIVIFVIFFQVITFGFVQVKADIVNGAQQPEVCAGPSKTMSLYFDFQREVISALYGSEAVERPLSTSMGDGWLFSRGTIKLQSSALDYVVSSLFGKEKSLLSAANTSVILLLLARVGVVESDLESFAILFKDIPIVRDYKELLDIETEIFNVTYAFSKRVDLRRPFDGDALERFYVVIEKYQKSGLLRKGESYTANDSISNIVSDLVSMNSAMKYFLSKGGDKGALALKNYAGCLSHYKGNDCSAHFVLGFDFDAIAQLEEDYKGSWGYGECNSYASNLKTSTYKAANNNGDSVEESLKSVEVAISDLKNGLLGVEIEKDLTDPCNISEYEAAQLQAYWGGDWVCGSGVSASAAYEKMQEYVNNKKVQNEQRQNVDNLLKRSSRSDLTTLGNVAEKIKSKLTTSDKEQLWFNVYSGMSRYNPEFSHIMNDEFFAIFEEVIEDFDQSENAVMASDLSYELVKIKGLVNQIDAAMKGATELRKHLQDIADYQCSN